jgi:N-acetylmuramic acid 6-phosphate (MurNAc-6-P) etherase
MKAGTATKLVLNTITTAAMVRSGKVFDNLMVDLQVTCAKLQDRGERILVETLGVERDEARSLLEGSGGNVKRALENLVIDNYLFGVAAVGADGNESVVAFPTSQLRR